MRARCLLTIVRRLTKGADALDEDERAGLYVIVCEAEIAIDTAAETWGKGYRAAVT